MISLLTRFGCPVSRNEVIFHVCKSAALSTRSHTLLLDPFYSSCTRVPAPTDREHSGALSRPAYELQPTQFTLASSVGMTEELERT